MNEMMTWVSPKCAVQRFEANDHVTACADTTSTFYKFTCDALKKANEYLADLWVYNKQTGDDDTWMSTWTGSKDNSDNLTPGGSLFDWSEGTAFTACQNTAEFLTDTEIATIQRGWIDANAWDTWSPTSGDAESWSYNVWIWTDKHGDYHASTDMKVHTNTVIGNYSK